LTCHIKWGTIKYKFKITFKFVELALLRLDVVIDEDLLQIQTGKLLCLFLTKPKKDLAKLLNLKNGNINAKTAKLTNEDKNGYNQVRKSILEAINEFNKRSNYKKEIT